MSSFRSRLKGIFRNSKPPLQTSDKSTTSLGSGPTKPSTSTAKSKRAELDFLELVSGTDPVVDIVAIHGLDGHRERTWTADNGVLWLRDLLSIDIPNARILVYGYDADTRSQECVSTQTIYQHADKFVKSLIRQRRDSPRRPIIFIGHSLGGIVLKQALVLCHVQTLSSTNQLRDILVSTHAVLFFGTPHSGVKGVEFVKTMNSLLSVYLKTTEVILRNLKENSPELENIQSLYTSASEGIQTVLFYEVYPTPTIGGRKQLIVPHHSATVAGDRHATEEALSADHCEMVKFPDADHANYVTVLSYLKQHIEGATPAVARKWSAEDGHRALANGEKLLSHGVVLPKPRLAVSRNYVDRPRIQSLMTENLLPGDRGRHQPRCILYGIGGAGKTQLATNWIREHENRFTRVITVDASSQTQLEKDLELSIRSLGSQYAEMSWKDAISYLDGKERGWLLFLDNADSPDLDLRPYLPASIHGTVLITTRNSECVGYAPDGTVPVKSLEESEAVKLLHTVANITPTSDAESLRIVRELGMLALAITQAGTYIRKTRRLDTYLDTFRRHRDRLLRKRPEIGIEYTSSTYTAFDLSFDSLPARTQEFLKLCAFLHHSLIPISLFEQSTVSGFAAYTVLNSRPPPESDTVFISNLEEIFGSTWDEVTFQEIVDSAFRTSFLDISSDGLFYSVHPLLQVYIKDRLDEEENRHYLRMTAQMLLGAIRPVEGSNVQLWQLLPHANNIPHSMKSENASHALAFGKLYQLAGDYHSSRKLLESALSQLQRTEGKEHKDLILIMNELAISLHSCGLLNDAEKLQREVLALQFETLGERHTNTLRAMNNLATTLHTRGQLEEAEKMQREALALRLEVLGGCHADTITTMNNLAAILRDRGQLSEAEKMQREVVARWQETLGGRHTDTITAMNNLATTLLDHGQLDEAEKMQQEVLVLWREILGEHHTTTITALNNLAVILRYRGQLDEAEKMQREVVMLLREVLGGRHAHTVTAMHNLATTLHTRGQLEEAEKMQREVATLWLEILGGRHTGTIKAIINLGLTLYARGQLDEAEKMQRDVVTLLLEILGGRHTDTITAMNNLGLTLHARGQLEGAEKTQREVLALHLEILGGRHTGTVTAMNNLAITLYALGQLEEAEKIQREVVALWLEILGKRHTHTVMAVNTLATILRVRGQLDEAEKMRGEVLVLQAKALGQ